MRLVRPAVAAIVLALAACGNLAEGGTTKQYGKCRASLIEQGLGQDAARAFCVTAAESPVKVDVKGTASYQTAGDSVSFQGRFTNPSSDNVVTGVVVKVVHGSEGKENLFRIDRIWVEPGASFDFAVPQGGMAYVPPPNRRASPAQDGTRWTWDVTEVRGIRIVP